MITGVSSLKSSFPTPVLVIQHALSISALEFSMSISCPCRSRSTSMSRPYVSSPSRPRYQCCVLPRLVVTAGSPQLLVVNHPHKDPVISSQSGTVGRYKRTGSETTMCEVNVTLPATFSLILAPCSLLSALCSLLSAPCNVLPGSCSAQSAPCSLLPAPCSLLPAPWSLIPAPCFLLPAPCFLLPALFFPASKVFLDP